MSIIIKSGNSPDLAQVSEDGLKVDTGLSAAATLGDALANPTTAQVAADGMVYNGTTWERARTSTAANATTGTGIPAAGVLGHDGTNYRRLKTSAAGELAVAITNPDLPGQYVGVSPFGAIQVNMDGPPMLTDMWEGNLDTTNRWVVSGTVAPSTSTSELIVNPGGNNNATVAVTSQPTFLLATSVTFGCNAQIEATPATGNHRFWGFGTPPSTPGTADNPLQNAVGFEVDIEGVLRASTYADGIRVSTQALTYPSDGLSHIYVIIARGDVTFFYRDVMNPPVAIAFAGPAVKTLPVRFASLNGAPMSGTPLLDIGGMSVLDNSRTAHGLSDGTYPWRKARVDTAGALTVAARATDLVLSATGSAGSGVTATLPAAGPGIFHYITRISITKYCTNTIAGNATPTTVTTTNAPGTLAYTLPTAMSTGTSVDRIEDFTAAPLKVSTANTATTVVAPGTSNVIWRVTVQYYVGP